MSMFNNEKLALKQAAERAQAASNAYTACVISQEEFLAETSDYRTLIRGPERVLALLAERDADKKRIAELEESHKKLRETMAAIHNTIRADGAYTPLAAIMSGVKRAYEDSAAVAGIKLEVGE